MSLQKEKKRKEKMKMAVIRRIKGLVISFTQGIQREAQEYNTKQLIRGHLFHPLCL